MASAKDKAQRVEANLAERCRRISNLYIAYHNSGTSSDIFGREFFHAVGDILNGTPLHRLEVFHIDPKRISEVLSANSQTGSPKRKRRRS